ncbi:MAG: head completion/stabilization protein [Porticoccaceae bacterium]
MSLIAYGTAPTQDAPEAIDNNGFWPAVDPADFRQTHRIDTSIAPPRVSHALALAIADINRQLADWQTAQQAAGASTADDIPSLYWANPGYYLLLYRQAVYATAHALLMERYRDHSATGVGDERGQAKDFAADDYRRDARWAVAEITGRTHTTVELI